MTPLEAAANQVINSVEIQALVSEYENHKTINSARNGILIPYENLLQFQVDKSNFLRKGYQIG